MFDGIGGKPGPERSLWRTVFDTEAQQRWDIDELDARTTSVAEALSDRSATLEHRVEALERRVAELALVNRALVAVLRGSGALETFDETLLAFDLEDGRADGR